MCESVATLCLPMPQLSFMVSTPLFPALSLPFEMAGHQLHDMMHSLLQSIATVSGSPGSGGPNLQLSPQMMQPMKLVPSPSHPRRPPTHGGTPAASPLPSPPTWKEPCDLLQPPPHVCQWLTSNFPPDISDTKVQRTSRCALGRTSANLIQTRVIGPGPHPGRGKPLLPVTLNSTPTTTHSPATQFLATPLPPISHCPPFHSPVLPNRRRHRTSFLFLATRTASAT